MKEKRQYSSKAKKGDGNPFAGYLYEDEKILWMDGPRGGRAPNDRKLFATLWIAGLIIWIAMLLPVAGISVVISTSCACGFLIGMVYLLAALWPIESRMQASPKGVYALTNRHLFYWDGKQVTELALEDVPEILLMPGVGSQGPLTFANAIPAMTNIDDAIYVKTMIEQARKRRLEEHS